MPNAPYNSLPVYQKSLALRDLSNAVANYFSNDNVFFKLHHSSSLREQIAKSIFTDSNLISKQIEQAETSGSYEVRMNSATFINIITRNILYYCNGLENDGVREKEYLNLLRRELKAFRVSFKQWRKSLQ